MSVEEVDFRNQYPRGGGEEDREPVKELSLQGPQNGEGQRKLGPKWEASGEQTRMPTGSRPLQSTSW